MSNNKGYRSDVELLEEILTELQAIRRKMPDNSKQAIDSLGLIDNADLVQLLRITARSASAWRKNGTLPYSKVNGKIFYHLSDIEKMMQEKFNKTLES